MQPAEEKEVQSNFSNSNTVTKYKWTFWLQMDYRGILFEMKGKRPHIFCSTYTICISWNLALLMLLNPNMFYWMKNGYFRKNIFSKGTFLNIFFGILTFIVFLGHPWSNNKRLMSLKIHNHRVNLHKLVIQKGKFLMERVWGWGTWTNLLNYFCKIQLI